MAPGMNFWWSDGDCVARLHDDEHVLLATHFELALEGEFDGDKHWRVIAELNVDEDDEDE